MKTLAHDMRNLFAVIEGQSELGETACLNLLRVVNVEEAVAASVVAGVIGTILERFRRSNAASQAARGMLNRFVAPTTISPGTFDLNASIKRVVFMIGENLNFIQPVLTLADGQIPIAGDWLAFCRLLTNLCMNARNAIAVLGRVDGVIEIGSRLSSNGRCRMIVTDNGCGMSPEMLARVWASVGDGEHGYGLQVVHKNAHELGGYVTVASERGAGSSFIVTLPVAGAVAAQESESAA